MLLLLILLGSSIFVSAFVVHIRRKAFEVKFREIETEISPRGRSRTWFSMRSLSRPPAAGGSTENEQLDRGPERHDNTMTSRAIASSIALETGEEDHQLSGWRPRPSNASLPEGLEKHDPGQAISGTRFYNRETMSLRGDRITFSPDVRFRRRDGDDTIGNHSQTFISRVLSSQGVGARQRSSSRRYTMQSGNSQSINTSHDLPIPKVSTQRESSTDAGAAISRNSNFHHLTEQDRLRLGGTEYRAVVFLSWVVPIYFVMWQLLGCLAMGAYINNFYASVCRENGLNPWYARASNSKKTLLTYLGGLALST